MANEQFQRIAEAAYQRLGNPLVVFDTSYRLLARSENPVDDDPIWNELCALGTFSAATVDFFQRAEFIAAVADTDAVALLRSGELPYERACAKFFDSDGVQLGAVTTVACLRPFVPADYACLLEVCEQLSQANHAAQAEERLVERVFHEEWISRLLAGEEPPGGAALPGAQARWFVGVADISHYDPSLSHMAYFRDTFAHLESEHTYFVYLNNIVMLLRAEPAWLRADECLGTLRSFFAEHGIYAGASGPFHDLRELRRYYRQALEALDRGVRLPCGQHIFQYEAFGTGALCAAWEQTGALALCNPLVLQMRACDQTHGTEHCKVLRAYLLAGKNEKKAAEQLGIAQKTMHRRLEKMGALFELDWDDGDLLASLVMTLRLLAPAAAAEGTPAFCSDCAAPGCGHEQSR